MADAETVLQVQTVSKAFGGVQALQDVSLEVKKGEVLGIIGPNGSGKTTLINVVTGFIRPDAGAVLFREKPITHLPPHRIVDLGISRTFQVMRPYHSLPAYKNLIVPLFSPRVRRTAGGRLGDRDAVAIDLLEEIGFERDAQVPYKTAASLPLGYLKRLELARCLALKPEVVFCDEVFSGLSMSEIASLVPLLERLNLEGLTLVMVEHRLRELFRLAHRVVVLSFGEKLAEDSPDRIMLNEQVREAYLGTEVADA